MLDRKEILNEKTRAKSNERSTSNEIDHDRIGNGSQVFKFDRERN